jgi:group I intron endonuclease
MSELGSVYVLIFPGGKRYVGKTIRPVAQRWAQHVYAAMAKSSCRRRVPVNNAIRKYGKENVRIRVLARCHDEETLCALERFYIKDLRTRDPVCGYNIVEGGEGVSGYHPPPEVRAKISKFHKEHPTPTQFKPGHKMSPETRAKIAETMTGQTRGPFSAEHRQRISASHLGKELPPRSPEYRANVSARMKAMPDLKMHSQEARSKANESMRARALDPEERAKLVARLEEGRKNRTYGPATPQSNAKRSESLRAFYAAHPEERKRIGTRHKGRVCSEATKARMRAAQHKRFHSPQGDPPCQGIA